MITGYNDRTPQLNGLSTDEKPINSTIGNGAIFFEMDTCKVYVFDEENQEWIELE